MATVTADVDALAADLGELRAALAAERHTRDALAAELAAVRARLDALERTRPKGPRDGADVELIATIARQIGGARWTCRELLRHARTDSVLRHALTAADIRTPIELGMLLNRLAGRTVDGRIVHRARLRDGRARWWVAEVEPVEAVEP